MAPQLCLPFHAKNACLNVPDFGFSYETEHNLALKPNSRHVFTKLNLNLLQCGSYRIEINTERAARKDGESRLDVFSPSFSDM